MELSTTLDHQTLFGHLLAVFQLVPPPCLGLTSLQALTELQQPGRIGVDDGDPSSLDGIAGGCHLGGRKLRCWRV